MEFLMDLAQMFVGYVCIDLGGADAAVAEHHLDTSYVCAVH